MKAFLLYWLGPTSLRHLRASNSIYNGAVVEPSALLAPLRNYFLRLSVKVYGVAFYYKSEYLTRIAAFIWNGSFPAPMFPCVIINNEPLAISPITAGEESALK